MQCRTASLLKKPVTFSVIKKPLIRLPLQCLAVTAFIFSPLSPALALSGADQAVLKETHASLMTLALEAARTDSDSANIR